MKKIKGVSLLAFVAVASIVGTALGVYVLFWQSQTVTHTITFKGLAGLLMQTDLDMTNSGNNYIDKTPTTGLADVTIRQASVGFNETTLSKAAMLVIEDGYFDADLRVQIDVSCAETEVTATCSGVWAVVYNTSAGLKISGWDDSPITMAVNLNGGTEYTTVSYADAMNRFMYETMDEAEVPWGELPSSIDQANVLILSFDFDKTDGVFGDIDFDITVGILGDDA